MATTRSTARRTTAPEIQSLPPSLPAADGTLAIGEEAPVHARALQRRLIHSFEHGRLEAPSVRRYSPGMRLLLLFGATAMLWLTIFRLAQIAIGAAA